MLIKIKAFLLSCLFMFIFIVSAYAQSQLDTKAVKEQLKEMLPNFKVSEINPTDIPEVYEVISESGQIIYYNPKGYLIFGEIWTVTGNSITLNRKAELQKKKVQEALNNIPYDSAVKIGNGRKKIIEISDPICPYCRIASDKLKEYKDVTRYVFFFPLSGEDSMNYISYILCSKDPQKAYQKVYSGKLDKEKPSPSKECRKKTENIIKEHLKFVQKLAVRGTPYFIINGTPVEGANMQLIESLLNQDSSTN